jgi:hypothetical protein
MKKVFTSMFLVLALLVACATDGIKPSDHKPIKPTPYAELRSDPNVVVRTNVQVLSSNGEVVTIPLVAKKSKSSSEAKIPNGGRLASEQLYVVTVQTNDIKPSITEITTNVVKLPEPIPAKKSWWERNKKKLLSYYAFSAVSGLIIWKGWDRFFGKKKKVKAKLVQTGNFDGRA